MKVKQFIEAAKLDWSDLHFEPDGGTGYSCPFEMKPQDFITFAKADFFNTDNRALANALSNAKRAVDCQVDGFLIAIGLDPQRLDQQMGKDGVRFVDFWSSSIGGPLKLRLLQALGFTTPSIIARMRRLRNLIEHEYKKPRKKEVGDAIDVAELFVHACRGRMRSPMTSFGFGSGITNARGPRMVERVVHFRFAESGEASCELSFFDHDAISKSSKWNPVTINIKAGDVEFVPVLKLVWEADWDKDMTSPIKFFCRRLVFNFQRPDSEFVDASPVGRVAQATVCKTVQVGATPARDSNLRRTQ